MNLYNKVKMCRLINDVTFVGGTGLSNNTTVDDEEGSRTLAWRHWWTTPYLFSHTLPNNWEFIFNGISRQKKMQLQTFFSHFLIFREYLHIQQCRFFVSLSECINLTDEYFWAIVFSGLSMKIYIFIKKHNTAQKSLKLSFTVNYNNGDRS